MATRPQKIYPRSLLLLPPCAMIGSFPECFFVLCLPKLPCNANPVRMDQRDISDYMASLSLLRVSAPAYLYMILRHSKEIFLFNFFLERRLI